MSLDAQAMMNALPHKLAFRGHVSTRAQTKILVLLGPFAESVNTDQRVSAQVGSLEMPSQHAIRVRIIFNSVSSMSDLILLLF